MDIPSLYALDNLRTELNKDSFNRFERILNRYGIGLEEAMRMDEDELFTKMADMRERGDAEDHEEDEKEKALRNQREGQAPYLVPGLPQMPEGWCLSYSTLPCVDPDTGVELYNTSIFSGNEGFMLCARTSQGRPDVKDIITTLQVTMAFPEVGKPRRPMSVLVAWRMRDMFEEIAEFLRLHCIMAIPETREEAALACQAHGTDIEGKNFDPREEDRPQLSPFEKLKDEGNKAFALKRYSKAIAKYTEGLELDTCDKQSAVMYSNRSIAYLRMGNARKALEDAEALLGCSRTGTKRAHPVHIKIVQHARKGQALEKLGRVEEARALYEHCIKSFQFNLHFKEALAGLPAAA